MADNSWFQQIRDEYGELSINEFANYWRNSKQIPDEYLGLDDVELSMQVLAENPGAAVMIDNNSMAQGVKSFWNTLKHQWAPGWKQMAAVTAPEWMGGVGGDFDLFKKTPPGVEWDPNEGFFIDTTEEGKARNALRALDQFAKDEFTMESISETEGDDVQSRMGQIASETLPIMYGKKTQSDIWKANKPALLEKQLDEAYPTRKDERFKEILYDGTIPIADISKKELKNYSDQYLQEMGYPDKHKEITRIMSHPVWDKSQKRLEASRVAVTNALRDDPKLFAYSLYQEDKAKDLKVKDFLDTKFLGGLAGEAVPTLVSGMILGGGVSVATGNPVLGSTIGALGMMGMVTPLHYMDSLQELADDPTLTDVEKADMARSAAVMAGAGESILEMMRVSSLLKAMGLGTKAASRSLAQTMAKKLKDVGKKRALGITIGSPIIKQMVGEGVEEYTQGVWAEISQAAFGVDDLTLEDVWGPERAMEAVAGGLMGAGMGPLASVGGYANYRVNKDVREVIKEKHGLTNEAFNATMDQVAEGNIAGEEIKRLTLGSIGITKEQGIIDWANNPLNKPFFHEMPQTEDERFFWNRGAKQDGRMDPGMVFLEVLREKGIGVDDFIALNSSPEAGGSKEGGLTESGADMFKVLTTEAMTNLFPASLRSGVDPALVRQLIDLYIAKKGVNIKEIIKNRRRVPALEIGGEDAKFLIKQIVGDSSTAERARIEAEVAEQGEDGLERNINKEVEAFAVAAFAEFEQMVEPGTKKGVKKGEVFFQDIEKQAESQAEMTESQIEAAAEQVDIKTSAEMDEDAIDAAVSRGVEENIEEKIETDIIRQIEEKEAENRATKQGQAGARDETAAFKGKVVMSLKEHITEQGNADGWIGKLKKKSKADLLRLIKVFNLEKIAGDVFDRNKDGSISFRNKAQTAKVITEALIKTYGKDMGIGVTGTSEVDSAVESKQKAEKSDIDKIDALKMQVNQDTGEVAILIDGKRHLLNDEEVKRFKEIEKAEGPLYRAPLGPKEVAQQLQLLDLKKDVLGRVKGAAASEVTFTEVDKPGYPARTQATGQTADLTIDFAKTARGSGATKKYAKKYQRVNINSSGVLMLEGYDSAQIKIVLEEAAEILATGGILNIAGHGVYSIDATQDSIDKNVLHFLKGVLQIVKESGRKVTGKVITGGQTGFDEAAAKAAMRLGISVEVIAPKDWTFRDKSGVDRKGMDAFTARFGFQPKEFSEVDDTVSELSPAPTSVLTSLLSSNIDNTTEEFKEIRDSEGFTTQAAKDLAGETGVDRKKVDKWSLNFGRFADLAELAAKGELKVTTMEALFISQLKSDNANLSEEKKMSAEDIARHARMMSETLQKQISNEYGSVAAFIAAAKETLREHGESGNISSNFIDAASEMVKGIAEFLKPKPGAFGMGPIVRNPMESYKAAAPHFQTAWINFQKGMEGVTDRVTLFKEFVHGMLKGIGKTTSSNKDIISGWFRKWAQEKDPEVFKKKRIVDFTGVIRRTGKSLQHHATEYGSDLVETMEEGDREGLDNLDKTTDDDQGGEVRFDNDDVAVITTNFLRMLESVSGVRIGTEQLVKIREETRTLEFDQFLEYMNENYGVAQETNIWSVNVGHITAEVSLDNNNLIVTNHASLQNFVGLSFDNLKSWVETKGGSTGITREWREQLNLLNRFYLNLQNMVPREEKKQYILSNLDSDNTTIHPWNGGEGGVKVRKLRPKGTTDWKRKRELSDLVPKNFLYDIESPAGEKPIYLRTGYLQASDVLQVMRKKTGKGATELLDEDGNLVDTVVWAKENTWDFDEERLNLINKELATNYKDFGLEYPAFIAGMKSGSAKVIVIVEATPGDAEIGLSDNLKRAYFDNEVKKGRMTEQQRDNFVNHAETAEGLNPYVWIQSIGRHNWWKAVKGQKYMMREKVWAQWMWNRLRIDLSEGHTLYGMGDTSLLIVDPKDTITTFNDKVINTFYDIINSGENRYLYDGVIWSGWNLFRPKQEMVGRTPSNKDNTMGWLKTYIRDLRVNRDENGNVKDDSYLGIKGLEMLVEPGMSWYEKREDGSQGRLLAKSIEDKQGNPIIVDAEGRIIDQLVTSEEVKISDGEYAKRNEIHTIPETANKVLQVPGERAKDSAPGPYQYMDALLNANLHEESPEAAAAYKALTDYFIKVADTYVQEMRGFSKFPKRMALYLKKLSNRKSMVSDEVQELLSYLKPEAYALLKHDHFVDLYESMLTNRLIKNGAFKGRATGESTYLHLRPDVTGELKEHEFGTSTNNTVVWNRFKRMYRDTLKDKKEIRSFYRMNIQGQIDAVNGWLESDPDISESDQWYMAYRIPIVSLTAVNMYKLKKFVHPRYGDVSMFHAKVVFGDMQGDFDGDTVSLVSLPENVTTAMMNFARKRPDVKGGEWDVSDIYKKKRFWPKLELFDTPEKHDLSEGHHISRSISSAYKNSTAQGYMTNMKALRAVLAFKDFQLRLKDGDSEVVIRIVNPEDKVLMDYAPLAEGATEDMLFEGESIENNRLVTTSENEMTILQQAAVDDVKFGLLEKWGYNVKDFVIRRIFKAFDENGNPIPLSPNSISTIREAIKPFKFGKLRQGHTLEGKPANLSDIIAEGRSLWKFASLDAGEFNARMKEINSQAYPQYKAMVISASKNENDTPLELILPIVYGRYAQMEGNPLTIVKMNENKHDNSHVEAMKMFGDALEELIRPGVISEFPNGVTSEDILNGHHMFIKLATEFYAILKEGSRVTEEAIIQPTMAAFNYKEAFLDFKQKYQAEVNSLSPEARFVMTFKFLSGLSGRSGLRSPQTAKTIREAVESFNLAKKLEAQERTALKDAEGKITGLEGLIETQSIPKKSGAQQMKKLLTEAENIRSNILMYMRDQKTAEITIKEYKMHTDPTEFQDRIYIKRLLPAALMSPEAVNIYGELFGRAEQVASEQQPKASFTQFIPGFEELSVYQSQANKMAETDRKEHNCG